MDEIVEYMVKRKWSTDLKSERKIYLLQLARQSKASAEISEKIGAMLIYNQVIEQFLADIIELSIYYIKAEIWPASVQLKVDFEKTTFGKMIELFKQYATIEYNRDTLLSYLKEYKTKRNQVVHKLFDIEDFAALSKELDQYADLADEIVHLLAEYDNQVCEKFCDLDQRVDFCDFLEC